MELVTLKGQKSLAVYENFLFFSLADEDNREDGFPTDILCRGNVKLLAQGLSEMMNRHPVLVSLLCGAVALYIEENPQAKIDTSFLVTNK